jgi:hypothetical protein
MVHADYHRMEYIVAIHRKLNTYSIGVADSPLFDIFYQKPVPPRILDSSDIFAMHIMLEIDNHN